MSNHIYNLHRQPADERDFKFAATFSPAPGQVPPKEADLRKGFEPIYDQGELGSCTANAGCAYRDMLLNDVQDKIKLSRLYLYYKEREIEGSIAEDSGASMRTICKTLEKFGVCEERFMPYVISQFTVKPTPDAETNAAGYKISAYHQIMTIGQIKECIGLKGRPVLLGMEVYNQFETIGSDGKLVLPVPGQDNLGGHAVLAVGYKDCGLGKGYLIVRNSWGPYWGDKGYFYMPYEYVTRGYAFDFWTID